jgi:hypothetical protein
MTGFREGDSRVASPVIGDEGDRTPDLLNAIQALSHLSYAPGVRFSDMGGDFFCQYNFYSIIIVVHNVSCAGPVRSDNAFVSLGKSFGD